MSINDGGPAFPRSTGNLEIASPTKGMSLRDYFAAKAMAAYMSNHEALSQLRAAIEEREQESGDIQRASMHTILARRAYRLADSMLKARDEELSP